MNKKEMRLLFEKVFDDKGRLSLLEFEPAYVDAVNNADFHDAVFYTFLMYLQGRMKNDPETLEILKLVKETIELLLVKSKDIPKNSLKKKMKPLPDGSYCSFCGKSKDEAQMLISGPSVFICNECVRVCVGLLNKSKSAKKIARPSKKTPKSKTKPIRQK